MGKNPEELTCQDVKNTKNRMARYTILSGRNLTLFTEYWLACGKTRDILFPNKLTKKYRTVSFVEQVIRPSARAAGLSGVTPHCLRHSFATHLSDGDGWQNKCMHM